MGKTYRERLIDTLNHRDPGQVVVDLGSTSITGININALVKLRFIHDDAKELVG